MEKPQASNRLRNIYFLRNTPSYSAQLYLVLRPTQDAPRLKTGFVVRVVTAFLLSGPFGIITVFESLNFRYYENHIAKSRGFGPSLAIGSSQYQYHML
jgi:hypothetical protein